MLSGENLVDPIPKSAYGVKSQYKEHVNNIFDSAFRRAFRGTVSIGYIYIGYDKYTYR